MDIHKKIYLLPFLALTMFKLLIQNKIMKPSGDSYTMCVEKA